MSDSPEQQKSPRALREEEILSFWIKEDIFNKTLEKPSPKGEFVFYEGPPTANGKPGIHHLEARAFKDAIPRFKTMQGYHVRRKGGWDTHGLPVELQVEKELGLKSKKEIENYGIEKFNQKCRESVWTYVDLWEKFTNRIGYWVDLKQPYITYKTEYIESLWSIIKRVSDQGLLYKDYKVVPWCPRCGTALSSHELAQGYELKKDLSVFAKFKLNADSTRKLCGTDADAYLLAWTTTPWTLPGNVALAVNSNIEYVRIRITNHESRITEEYILAKARLSTVKAEYEIIEEFKGEKLVGLEYEPLYPFLKDNLSESENAKLPKAFKVYAADFVTTEDGTGIVHTAVMYGADDFELGTKIGLPKHHLVKEDGTFKEESGFLAGKFVKSEETDVSIIKDLASRGLLFGKEKYEHSYPFCWRCKTPLIYFARDSWYIRMSALRDKLVENNKSINWEPSHIKEGRFGEWLKDVKDWAISRERYWGTPLPVWECNSCDSKEVIGSLKELQNKSSLDLSRIYLIRHGESEKNIACVLDSEKDKYPLTEKGIEAARKGAEVLDKEGVDIILSSPVRRSRETAEIISKKTGVPVQLRDELWEVRSGSWDGMKMGSSELRELQKDYFSNDTSYYETKRGGSGESWKEVEVRMYSFLKEALAKHPGKKIAIVSHEGPLIFLLKALRGVSVSETRKYFDKDELGGYAMPYGVYVDKKSSKEFDPHRPFIDSLKFRCACGGEMSRVKEVMDVWFDSGAMPFAQDHVIAEKPPLSEKIKNLFGKNNLSYPADFISEAIDQTRGWFYTLHAIGALLGKGAAYKNVICLGHILDKEGKKMSKSLGNVVDPWTMIDKYGVDTVRFWMYSVNQPGDSKNFDERTVDETSKKVFNLLENILSFYELYAKDVSHTDLNPRQSPHALDQWIFALLGNLTEEVTSGLSGYKLLEPARAIRDFSGELSQWYIRRSRDRFKSDDEKDKAFALSTTREVLLTLSKLMAPLSPFFAENIYHSLKTYGGNLKESVHLESWPEVEVRNKKQKAKIIGEMAEVRKIVSFALEQRAKANIKIRQPLAALRVGKNHESGIMSQESLLNLIKDEVNVKEVVLDKDIAEGVSLDIIITSELKEEGNVREIVRTIQDLRKKEGLSPGDRVVLLIGTEEKGKSLIEKYRGEIQKVTGLSSIEFGALSGETLTIGDLPMTFTLKK